MVQLDSLQPHSALCITYYYAMLAEHVRVIEKLSFFIRP